jgi:phage nucleotide-binding protein
MAIQLMTTKGYASDSVKILVHGQSGVGKTTLIGTLPNPVVISAEGGLLALADLEIPYLNVTSMTELNEAYEWLLNSKEADQFQSVAIDSISEIAEVVLNTEKKLTKDPRQAYGALQEQMTDLIRAFRDLPKKHVYMSAKTEKATDENGRILYSPSMPGNKLGQMLPYFFDEVLALRVERDADGATHRGLMCDSDGLWTAKDRSGKLSPWEDAELGAIIRKITGES